MENSRDLILLGLIVLMLISVLIEVLYSFYKGKKIYILEQTVSHVLLGIGQQSVNFLATPFLMIIYIYIQKNHAFFEIDKSLYSWISVILLCDLTYYVAHRASHRVNYLIIGHQAHHQAKDYNHASAFRQGWSAHLLVFPFYLPLAILGFPLEMFVLAQLGVMFIQFFSHNGIIQKKLGILEYIFVTPNSHRAHHGIDERYLDKNCGGMLIVWDRLFNTYAAFDGEITLGVKSKVNEFSPIDANINYLKKIIIVMNSRKSIRGKLSIWFETPETLSRELKKLNVIDFQAERHLPTFNLEVAFYLLISILLMGYLMSLGKNLYFPIKASLVFINLAFVGLSGKAFFRYRGIKETLTWKKLNILRSLREDKV